jgi:hypothetical protein
MFFKKKIYIIISLLTIVGLLFLPYYIFDSKLFIGGDDTRLLYIFPWEWIKNIAFYSWFHFSAVGTNNPNQTLLPFLLLWSVINLFITNKVVLDYLAFSLPLILGFIFFQKLIYEFIETDKDRYRFIFYVGSLIYILSPIIAFNQLSIFLYSDWLIGLFPILFYYYIRYLKTGNFTYAFINMLWCVALSFAISTLPWFLGLLLPVGFGLLVYIPYASSRETYLFLKRSIIFFGIFLLSQSFWVLSFVMNIFFVQKSSFLGNVLSQQTKDTFTPTVLSTASGNIFYPLINLFHRQISIDFTWPLRDIFFSFYDKTTVTDIVFVIIFFIAIFNSKKYLKEREREYYLLTLIAFLFSLFLFTVNIGPLKNVFLLMGKIPGFVMFRNFYDKFALGYTFLYGVIITLSLIITIRRFKSTQIWLPLLVLLVVLINIIPIKQVINKPIWTTNDIYTPIIIPQEYTNFMSQINTNVSSSTNILSLPYNIASYTIIKDETSNNIFAGRSPVQLFSGVNDFSGYLSFNSPDNAQFVSDITARNYKDFNNFLMAHNIGYVFITNNIPLEVKKSYLFDRNVLSYQDQKFIKSITSKKMLISQNGNYVIYKTKYPTSLFSPQNVTFKKINPVTYQLFIKNIKNPQQLDFLDSYDGGWKIYLEKYSLLPQSHEELSYLFRKDFFASSHRPFENYGNQWTIDPSLLKKDVSKEYYHINTDGSMNVDITLYFKPQENFYIGTVISVLTVFICFAYLFYSKRKEYEK